MVLSGNSSQLQSSFQTLIDRILRTASPLQEAIINSSLFDMSREWKQKAEETIKATIDELNKGNDNYSQSQMKRSAVQQVQQKTTKHAADIAAAAQEGEENENDRQEWAKTQINEINEQTKAELESIEQLRLKQQKYYESQLAAKEEAWDRALMERREEVNKLRTMIQTLNSDINLARSEAKADIDEAKKRAKESAKIIRANREKQIQQIAELTSAIQKEKNTFEGTLKQTTQAASSSLAQKKDQLARLQQNFLSMKAKLREKEWAKLPRGMGEAKIARQIVQPPSSF